MKKRILSIALTLCIITSIIPLPVNAAVVKGSPTDPVNAKITASKSSTNTKKSATKLSSKNITLKVGQKKILKLKNYNKLTKKQIKKVKWSSSNKKVAYISKVSGKYKTQGTIVAKSTGKAAIKVKYDGKTYQCNVNVINEPVTTTENKTSETTTTEKVTTETDTTEKTTETTTSTENNTKKEEIPTEHTHEWSEWNTVKIARCEEKGLETRACFSCQKEEQRETDALRHMGGLIHAIKAVTCEEAGLYMGSCVRCGKIDLHPCGSKGHKWEESGVIKAPTAEEPGIQRYYCFGCKGTKTEAIPMIGESEHKWNEGEITTPVTCTTNGVKTYTCENCGGTKTEEILAKGHTYDDGVITKEPTCTENGIRTYTCVNCGEATETDIYNKHTWMDPIIIKEPTCTEPGSIKFACAKCEYEIIKDLPKCHKYNENHKCILCGAIHNANEDATDPIFGRINIGMTQN